LLEVEAQRALLQLRQALLEQTPLKEPCLLAQVEVGEITLALVRLECPATLPHLEEVLVAQFQPHR
jgi:hypothetical protein